MIRNFLCLFFFAGILNFCACAQPAQEDVNEKGLKDYYSDYFPVGVSVSPRSLTGKEGALILKHFNSLTAENAMKMALIHPKEDVYSWKDADAIVDFAQQHGLKLRGHTLCWHRQAPDWIFKDDEGNPVSKEVLLKRLKDHITKVVTRYKGKIYAWDVVNEVISDNDNEFYRNSPWYSICGEDFIGKAFQYAHEADPGALLFYNDYNTENPGKRERINQMITKLKEMNVPVHGIGLQGHWSLEEPSEAGLSASIERFSSLGLKVQITELDISVYPPESETRNKRPGEDDTFTPEREQKQLEQYRKIFKVIREHKNAISGVTFWNVSDRHSWLDNFPVRGRKNYPLLFDQQLEPKKAYWEVVEF